MKKGRPGGVALWVHRPLYHILLPIVSTVFRIRYLLHIFNKFFCLFLRRFSPCSSVLRRCANSLSCVLCRVHRSDASASAPPPSDLFAAFAASLPSAGRCFSCPSFALPLSPILPPIGRFRPSVRLPPLGRHSPL
ncbi:hypothetical protein niasHT_027647 [Heterodera trifolii]|uniref:Transmembrane protein n=1 Tax=Heterodera trifolii TaxID=157864 RepID=A0ABD2K5E3_9BILA